MTSRVEAVLCILLFGAPAALHGQANPLPAVEPVYPGKDWATKPPADVGMDAERLEAMSRYVGGHGCVRRRPVLTR